jgi:large subunit ribosomal protein L25
MEATLDVVRRNRFGRNEAGRIRRVGLIPAVVYGEASEAEPVSVDPKALLKILRSQSGANTLITLKIDGATGAKVLVKEYQVHPVEAALLHADFYRVAMDKVLRVTVPVHLTSCIAKTSSSACRATFQSTSPWTSPTSACTTESACAIFR